MRCQILTSYALATWERGCPAEYVAEYNQRLLVKGRLAQTTPHLTILNIPKLHSHKFELILT